jgi:hypothetical protein
MKKLELESTLVKEKIRDHQNRSPTPVNEALDKDRQLPRTYQPWLS